MAKHKIQRGAAAIFIDLNKGTITIRHAEKDGAILAQLKDAPGGTWNKMWSYFSSLGILKPIQEEEDNDKDLFCAFCDCDTPHSRNVITNPKTFNCFVCGAFRDEEIED